MVIFITILKSCLIRSASCIRKATTVDNQYNTGTSLKEPFVMGTELGTPKTSTLPGIISGVSTAEKSPLMCPLVKEVTLTVMLSDGAYTYSFTPLYSVTNVSYIEIAYGYLPTVKLSVRKVKVISPVLPTASKV